MIDAIGAVLSLRYHHLFQATTSARLELFRGGSEDHYVAAFVEPRAYDRTSPLASRVASTIQTLRTAALSTYENHRVSTGALLLGPGAGPAARAGGRPALRRRADGAQEHPSPLRRRAPPSSSSIAPASSPRSSTSPDGPSESARRGPRRPSRPPAPALRAARAGDAGRGARLPGPEPEPGDQALRGRDPGVRLRPRALADARPGCQVRLVARAVADESVARGLFQAALDLAEVRRGGLFVVLDEPTSAVGRLIAPHDLLADVAPDGPSPRVLAPRPVGPPRPALPGPGPVGRRPRPERPGGPGQPRRRPGRRAGRPPPGLRRDPPARRLGPPRPPPAEGARTSAALVASRFGPVLKVSEDGIVSCYLRGARAWDL